MVLEPTLVYEAAMLLTGREIYKQVQAGNIQIDPFDQGRVNPNSYDLSLGDFVAVYSNWVVELEPSPDGRHLYSRDNELDIKTKPEVMLYKIDPEVGWLLKPGIGYLMHTVERIHTELFTPVLDGKSSIGRLFVAVHVTAGYGDTGFNGQYTLEVKVVHPIRVYPGIRFCQMRFHVPTGDITSYAGNYQGEAAVGPVPSRAHQSVFK